MPSKFSRLVKIIENQYKSVSPPSGSIPFGLRMIDGTVHVFGEGNPAFTIILNDEKAVTALSTLDQNTIVENYLNGNLDIEGDMMSVLALRELFNDSRGMRFLWRFIQPLLFGQVKSDKKWISSHYDTEADFFLLFLDSRHRAYSQGVFTHDLETLEDAETRKLDFAIEQTNTKPGSKVLDIGSGWGSFIEHAGKKGINVTSLTISKRSQDFVNNIINREQLPCKVLL